MPVSKINDVRLYWELTGDAGDPLVLVHGSLVDHHTWYAVVPQLARWFRVLTYDRRGHSLSERRTLPETIHEDVADLATIIETLGLAPVNLVGSSMGGSVALRLAIERPELVKTLIVNEPPLFGLLANDADAGLLNRVMGQIKAVMALLEARDYEDAVRQFVETVVFGPGVWERIPAEVRELVIFNAPTLLDETRDPDAISIDLEQLGHYGGPVLLMSGEFSPPVFVRIVERLAEALPQAMQVTFTGVVHEPEDSAPDVFAATVRDFVSKVATSTEQNMR